VHGECYRVKRELSELKEAAEAAEEAMGQQVRGMGVGKVLCRKAEERGECIGGGRCRYFLFVCVS
jgi:hypothetical protein